MQAAWIWGVRERSQGQHQGFELEQVEKLPPAELGKLVGAGAGNQNSSLHLSDSNYPSHTLVEMSSEPLSIPAWVPGIGLAGGIHQGDGI